MGNLCILQSPICFKIIILLMELLPVGLVLFQPLQGTQTFANLDARYW